MVGFFQSLALEFSGTPGPIAPMDIVTQQALSLERIAWPLLVLWGPMP